jgi:hypothetical protein
VAAGGTTPWGYASKIDYAINAGSWDWVQKSYGPVQVYSRGIWEWRYLGIPDKPVRTKDIHDGLGKTYLVGEKTVLSDYYESGYDVGDWDGIFNGDPDGPYPSPFSFSARLTLRRYADTLPARDLPSGVEHDLDHVSSFWNKEMCYTCQKFGSAHLKTWNMLFCDGSVHSISYDISLATHKALSTRDKGDLPNQAEY